MDRAIATVVALLWLAAPGRAAALEEQNVCAPAVRQPDPKLPGRIVVDWCGGAAAGAQAAPAVRLTGGRIDERTTVSVTVTHFNFLRYAVSFDVNTTVVETYATLDKLWKQTFGIVETAVEIAGLREETPPECTGVDGCISRWLFNARRIEVALDAELRKYAQAGLTAGEVGHIVKAAAASRKTGADCPTLAAVENLECTSGILLNSRARAEQALFEGFRTNSVNQSNMDYFARVDAQHAQLLNRLDAFVTAAGLVQAGQVRRIPRQKAGTVVSIAVSAKRAEGGPAVSSVEVEYFVHSKLPVVYHVGYAYSRLKEVDFEKVRALDNKDLFAQVKSTASTSALSAFLSLQLCAWGSAGTFGGLYGTIATDFAKPGERVYLGLSSRLFQKLFLTVGVASAARREGKHAVLERVGDALDARELFATTVGRRDWKPQFGVSFAVF